MWTKAQEEALKQAKKSVEEMERERSIAETHVKNDIADYVRNVCKYPPGSTNAEFAERFIFSQRATLLAFLADLPPLER